MPSVSFNTASLLTFFGVAALLFGFFLLLAGFGIITIDKVTVEKGRKTWTIGLLMVFVGFGPLTIDTLDIFSSSDTTAIPTIGALDVYDNFDNAAYDRVLNTNLWYPKLASTCTALQKDGYLEFTNAINSDSVECRIVAGKAVTLQELGTVEAEIKY